MTKYEQSAWLAAAPRATNGGGLMAWLRNCSGIAAAVIFALALGVGVAGAQQIPKPERASLRVGILPFGNCVSIYFAKERGYFTALGLDVSLVYQDAGVQLLPAMEAGKIDMAYVSALPLLTANSQGFDFVIIAGMSLTQGAKTGAILTLRSGPTKLTELTGKSVGFGPLGSYTDLFGRAALEKAGVDLRTVKVLTGPYAVLPDQLREGQVAAIFTHDPGLSVALSRGARVIATPYEDVSGGSTAFAQVASTRRFARANPKTIEAFVSGLERAMNFLNANETEWRAAIGRFLKLSPEVLAVVQRENYQIAVPVDRLRQIADLATKYGYAQKKVERVENMVWPTAVPKK